MRQHTSVLLELAVLTICCSIYYVLCSVCRLTEIAEEESANGKHVKVNGYHFLKTLGKGAYGGGRLQPAHQVGVRGVRVREKGSREGI